MHKNCSSWRIPSKPMSKWRSRSEFSGKNMKFTFLSFLLSFWAFLRYFISKTSKNHDFAHFSTGYKQYLDMFSWNFIFSESSSKHFLTMLQIAFSMIFTSILDRNRFLPRNFRFSGFSGFWGEFPWFSSILQYIAQYIYSI